MDEPATTVCEIDRQMDQPSDQKQHQHQQQSLNVFIKHVASQLTRHSESKIRRSSAPVDSIELPTLTGVVMKRKQQLQLRYQTDQCQDDGRSQATIQKHLLQPQTNKNRPLSISSISSAASSGSSSSATSSASSGIQSSLTRNGSLNYESDLTKYNYGTSIESLNNHQSDSIELALKQLNLSPSGKIKDSAARAAILAAGAQSRGFHQNHNNQSKQDKVSRINRSFHSSLRYDKSTACRIQLMANTRFLYNNHNQLCHTNNENNSLDIDDRGNRRTGSISRNNSSTSSDSGQNMRVIISNKNAKLSCQCECGNSRQLAPSSSVSQVDQDADKEKTIDEDFANGHKSATLDDATSRRNFEHNPDCFFSRIRTKRTSKLQPSPSSASSYSNTSSLFKDDGFEDDLTSSASEQTQSNQYHHHHRLSFQGRYQQFQKRLSVRTTEDGEEYQSCEEDFSNCEATTSTTSNIDDCALSTTSSSSFMQQDQLIIDEISLANAKKQYRKSLLLEHQQLSHQTKSSQSKIQSLLTPAPIICHLNPNINTNSNNNLSCGSPIGTDTTNNSSNVNINPMTNSNNNINTIINGTITNINNKQSKSDDRTVNIIAHMPTRSPGYWDSNLSITQRVVTEIIETERTYVDDLEQIVTGYICYLRNVLKLKMRQSQQSNKQTNQDRLTSSVLMVNDKLNTDDDNRSMLAFDDDTNTNDMENYDVDIRDNDESTSIKENIAHEDDDDVVNYMTTCVNNEGAIMTANHIEKLFSNLEDIYRFNKDLLFRLEECYLNPSSVAECFVENAAGFEIYTNYCTAYPQVVSTLTELMANPTSALLLKERQQELNQSLPLGSYLLKPVQRILKYHILFQSLIKHTTNDDTVDEKDLQLINEAYSVMTSIACHINTMKKRHEHEIRIQEVQGLLSGWEGPDLTTLGELILEDTFKLYNRPKSSRHLFLFDNVLLITKKKRDGSLIYKGHIACSNLMLIENIDGQPLVFNTVPFDNPKALCAFQAKNLDKKRDWCLQMKEVIIKSFEKKIPVHVKDILMSLTKTSSTELASKSESAKAIRAPNYLDKKRSRQDKKR